MNEQQDANDNKYKAQRNKQDNSDTEKDKEKEKRKQQRKQVAMLLLAALTDGASLGAEAGAAGAEGAPLSSTPNATSTPTAGAMPGNENMPSDTQEKAITNQKTKTGTVLDEYRDLKQKQEKLNQLRDATRKKENEEDESPEEEVDADEAIVEDARIKAEKFSALIRFIKLGGGPILLVAGSVIILFFVLMTILISTNRLSHAASIMDGSEKYINNNVTYPSQNSNSTNNESVNDSDYKPGKGTLGYPTTSRTISAGYPNYSNGSFHGGIDFPVPVGTLVFAAEAGKVTVSMDLKKSNGAFRSYGKYIIIDHGNGLSTLYAHNSQRLVKVGDVVEKGQLIAKSGATGNVTGPHVHFEVRLNGTRVNPNNYLAD